MHRIAAFVFLSAALPAILSAQSQQRDLGTLPIGTAQTQVLARRNLFSPAYVLLTTSYTTAKAYHTCSVDPSTLHGFSGRAAALSSNATVPPTGKTVALPSETLRCGSQVSPLLSPGAPSPIIVLRREIGAAQEWTISAIGADQQLRVKATPTGTQVAALLKAFDQAVTAAAQLP